MRADVPPGAMGYVAVHLPELSSWQGFYVVPTLRDRGEAVLAEARRMGGGQATDDGLPGLSTGDQAAVGARSATLAKLYSLATADPPPPAGRLDAIRWAIGAHVLLAPQSSCPVACLADFVPRCRGR